MRNKTYPANGVVIKGARPCVPVGRERSRGAREKQVSVVTAGAAMSQRCRQGGSLTLLLLLRLCLQERHGQEVRRNKELREEVTA